MSTSPATPMRLNGDGHPFTVVLRDAASAEDGDNGGGYNLFVRLDPADASSLHREAIENAATEDDDGEHDCDERLGDEEEAGRSLSSSPPSTMGCWRIHSRAGRRRRAAADDDDQEVEFLPLAVTLCDTASSTKATTIYASYNGGSIAVAPSSSSSTTRVAAASATTTRAAASAAKTTEDGETNGSIELCSTLHPALHAGAVVRVRPLHRTVNATSVHVEPLTSDDWELLEVHAASLEEGRLLSQVSVVYPHQVLTLRLGRDLVRMRILEDGFHLPRSCDVGEEHDSEHLASPKRSCDGNRSIGGRYDDEDEDDATSCSSNDSSGNSPDQIKSGQHECLRLVADTQFVVAPKVRKSASSNAETAANDTNGPSASLRIHPTMDDLSPNLFDVFANGEEGMNHSSFPTPPPCGAFVHPDTLSVYVPGWDKDQSPLELHDAGQISSPSKLAVVRIDSPLCGLGENPDRDSGTAVTSCVDCLQDINSNADGDLAVATIYPSERVPLDHIALHPYIRYQLGASPLHDAVKIQILTDKEVECGSRPVREGVRDGALRIKLNPVEFKPRSFRKERPWRYPNDARTSHVMCRMEAARDEIFETPLPLTVGSIFFMSPFSDPFGGNDSSLLAEAAYRLTLSSEERCSVSAGGTNSKRVSDGNITQVQRIENNASNKNIPPILFADELATLLSQDTCHENLDETQHTDLSVQSAKVGVSLSKDEPMVNILPPTRPYLCAILDTAVAGTEFCFESLARIPALSKPLMHGDCSVGGVIITGERGSGKTHLALVVAARLRLKVSCSTIYLDCKDLKTSSHMRMNDILGALDDAFHEAMRCQPSIIVLDDLDALTPNTDAPSGDDDGSVHHQQINPALVSQVKVISDYLEFLWTRMMSPNSPNVENERGRSTKRVTLLCTCRDLNSLSSDVKSAGIFTSVVEVPDLGRIDRIKIFDSMLSEEVAGSPFGNNRSIEDGFGGFGKKTEGYRPRDLHVLSSRILRKWRMLSLGRPENDRGRVTSLTEADVSRELLNYTPLAQQAVNLTIVSSSSDWSSVGGLFRAKQSLTDVILHPIKFSLIYERSPISLPRGILLYGPPGCGKSFMVPALANESNLNLVTCRGPELLDKYIGASEAKVRELFARASMAAPAILFLDEFDALAPRRGTDHTGVTDRVVNQLLTFLDGVESARKNAGRVYIVAASSRPDKIDPALLRPGRLARHVYVGYPENVAEWNDMFQNIVKSHDVDESVLDMSSKGNMFKMLGDEYPHAKAFSAADMKAVLDTAHLEAVHEILGLTADAGASDSETDVNRSSRQVVISKKHILNAVKCTRPSLSPDDRRMFDRICAPFLKEGAAPFLGDDSRLTSVGVGGDGDFASGPSRPWKEPALMTTLR